MRRIRKKNEITIQKIFDHWLHFSKMEFEKNDINEIKNNYSLEAKNILKKSLFGDNKKQILAKKVKEQARFETLVDTLLR